MATRSLPLPPASARVELAHPCIVRIVEVREGAVSVEVEGAAEPVVARVASTLSAKQLADAHAGGHSAVVVFERGDPSLPIVVGLLAPAAPPESGVVVETDAERPGAGKGLEADVDGKRVVLSAEDEVVLQCGKASITLRRNGRVVIRGVYVETYATGTNRVKGGQVLIN
jgi:hypothetical protein